MFPCGWGEDGVGGVRARHFRCFFWPVWVKSHSTLQVLPPSPERWLNGRTVLPGAPAWRLDP